MREVDKDAGWRMKVLRWCKNNPTFGQFVCEAAL